MRKFYMRIGKYLILQCLKLIFSSLNYLKIDRTNDRGTKKHRAFFVDYVHKYVIHIKYCFCTEHFWLTSKKNKINIVIIFHFAMVAIIQMNWLAMEKR